MTYGEKYKEVFGYYPEEIPCPDECPKEYENRSCEGCKYFNLLTNTAFREVEEDSEKNEKEVDRQHNRSDLSTIDIYNYLRTADPCEYGVIFSIAFYKMSEVMTFEDTVRMIFANLFASSGSFDAEIMYKAMDMILNNYKGGVKK